jgi:hypothetical protein
VTPIDPARVAELTERERARLAERRPRSVPFPSGSAGVFMPSGDPWTISIAHTENLARSVGRSTHSRPP